MRTVVVALLWLSTSTLASAQGSQADDDEKPGARQGAVHKAGADQSRDSYTPSPERTDPGGGTTGSAPTVHSEGRYAGVSLGGDGLPPKAPKLPLRAGPQRMTWPGFQVRDGVPTVFLQTTGAPNYTITERVGAVIVTLRGTTIKLRNNQRPLKVAEFGTDVTEISAKPHGKDVIVTINRKGDGHRERVEPSAGGFQLLVVELPKK